MKVLKLLTKQPDSGMVECERLTLVRGYGIEGDNNAGAGSPRQILLVDYPTLEQFGLQPGNLSENILVDASLESLISGQVVQVGSALIRPTFLCEPCSKLESLRKGLTQAIKGRRGWLGMVVKSGTVQVGDAIAPIPHQLAPLSDIAKVRFQEFIARIPTGKVVTTADLVLALGVADAYYRVIPTFIKTAPASLPVHRIVRVDGSLLTQHIPDQVERLTKEGVEIRSGIVSQDHRWKPEHFHELGNWGL